MQNTNIITCLLFLFFSGTLSGQVLDTRVSFTFGGWLLGDAVAEIGNSYNIQFVYSPDRIPVHETVTASVEDVSLSEGLDELLADVPVKYLVIGERIVLKPDRFKKLRSFTRYEIPLPADEAVVLRSPLQEKTQVITTGESADTLTLGSGEMPELDSITIEPSLKLLTREKIQNIKNSGGNSFRIPDIDLSFLDSINTPSGTVRAAQVSLMPGVSSNFKEPGKKTNRVSFNATWGVNGGVNGGELGVLGNTVKGNMQGLQIAGFGNVVKGSVIGTQVAGGFNKGHSTVIGAQFAGFRNKAYGGSGAQVAGLWNKVQGNYVGVQIAGLTNRVKGKNFGWQIAGLSNRAGGGRTQVQIAGFTNVAYDVSTAQVGLINIAHHVGGVQFGLINAADSVGMVSIGLLNFINNGFNRLDLARADVFQWNAAYKFGNNAFYNIIQVSLRSEDDIIRSGEDDWSEENISWAVGYGVGSSVRLGKRKKWRASLEAVWMHVNENKHWETSAANWFGQGRILLSRRLFGKLEIYAGPTFNVSYSNRVNPDTGEVGSNLPPDNLILNATGSNPTGTTYNTKLWWGWTGGFRF